MYMYTQINIFQEYESLIEKFILFKRRLLTENRLYFVDAGTHKIEAMQPDGSSRSVILTDSSAHFFAVSPYHQYLYYTDWNQQ